jgi:hypothetical protein
MFYRLLGMVVWKVGTRFRHPIFYRVLGMAVWKTGNWALRRKYGVTVPQGAAIAGAVLLAAGVAAGAARRGGRPSQLTP